MDNYIIIPKKNSEEEIKHSNNYVARINDKNNCLNCGSKPEFTLTFGKGVDEIEIKICRECLRPYKLKLDKEFGESFWNFINSLKPKPTVKIPVHYYNNN